MIPLTPVGLVAAGVLLLLVAVTTVSQPLAIILAIIAIACGVVDVLGPRGARRS